MSRQMSDGARRQPRRVAAARAPRATSPSDAGALADEVHQRAGGELWKVAEVGDDRIVRVRRHDVHRRAETGDERSRVASPLRSRSPAGVRIQGRPVKQSRPAPPRDRRWPRRRADDRRRTQSRAGSCPPPQRSAAWYCRRRSRPPRRGRRRASSERMPMLAAHGRGQDDQIRVRRHHEIVAADVCRVHSHRRLDDVLAIDGDQLAPTGHRLRAASAIDAPMSPKPTMAMRSNGAAAASPAPHGPSAASSARQCLSLSLVPCPFRALSLARRPSLVVRPARDRCCGRSPGR